jgi:Flp pilus assembly protein TadD
MFRLFKLLNNRSQDKRRDVEDYLVDAIYAFENGQLEDAARQFEIIGEAVPEHPLAYLMLGRCCLELEEYEKAANAFFQHLSIVPDSVEGLIYLGLTYYECGELESAQERFEEAMSLKRDSLLVKENLAITRLASGNFKSALEDLIALYEERPNDTGIIELIILTFGRLGKWEAAKQYVHKMEKANLGEQ